MASPSTAQAIRLGDERHFLETDREDHVLLVQHLVVLEVVQQRLRHGVGVGDGVDRRARRAPHVLVVGERGDERQQLRVVVADVLDQQLAAAPPRGHDGEDGAAEDEREPAALEELQRARRHQHRVDDEEEPGRRQRQRQRIAPAVAHDEEGEQRGDEHRHGHGDAVRRRKRRRVAEAEHRQQHGEHHEPVDERDVDLAGFLLGGVQHAHARQQPELDRLLGERERARDDGLRGDHRSERGEHDHWHQQRAREQAEERVLECARIADEQGALAHVVERQRRQHESVPGETDRLLAEVAHVGIERLGAGQRQHDRPHHHEQVPAAHAQEFEGTQRVEGREDRRMLRDLHCAGDREHREPDDDDRTEQLADGGRSIALAEEEADDHGHRDRQHVGLERRRDRLQPFHRAEHRDRRRDDAVAVEERGAEHAGEQQQRMQPRRSSGSLRGQRREGHDAALAAVVGTQDQDDVLERHDDHQGPEDRRDGADHVRGVENDRVDGVEDLLHRVQRAGADVAVHDAERAERQHAEGLPARG